MSYSQTIEVEIFPPFFRSKIYAKNENESEEKSHAEIYNRFFFLSFCLQTYKEMKKENHFRILCTRTRMSTYV